MPDWKSSGTWLRRVVDDHPRANNDGSTKGPRKKESALESSAKSGRNCANDKKTTDYTAEDDDSVHHFRGTIQILAYDDTT